MRAAKWPPPKPIRESLGLLLEGILARGLDFLLFDRSSVLRRRHVGCHGVSDLIVDSDGRRDDFWGTRRSGLSLLE
jgi:hypothetical protein